MLVRADKFIWRGVLQNRCDEQTGNIVLHQPSNPSLLNKLNKGVERNFDYGLPFLYVKIRIYFLIYDNICQVNFCIMLN